MKKTLIYFACIIAGFLLVDRGLSVALDAFIVKSEFRFSKLYRGGIDADVLVLGNSRSVNAFYAPGMEKELGCHVFHAGFNGMSMPICESVLNDYLAHNEAPKLVLIEVTNLGVGNGHLKEHKMYRSLSGSVSNLLSRFYPEIEAACSVSRLYQYNSELFLRSLYYLNQGDQSWINSGQFDPEAVAALELDDEFQTNMFQSHGDGWDALLRVLSDCREQNIAVRLVASPYYPAYLSELREVPLWKKSFLDVLPEGTPFYDYTEALQGYEYFADIVHINRLGGAALLEHMIADGLFSDLSFEE